MLRSIGVALVGFAVSVLAGGCGAGLQSFGAGAQDDVALAAAARPVAELTGAAHDGSKAFMGIGYSSARPIDSTLGSGSGLDLNMAFDLSSVLTFELMLGSWGFADQIPNVSESGSRLRMMPATAMVMLAKERRMSRIYMGVGGGYSFNSYSVGDAHAAAMAAEHVTVSAFDVTAKDGMLFGGVLGYEMYSTADAALNLALEARYYRASFDKTEWANPSTVFSEDSVDLDVLLLRAGVTWRF